MSKTRITVQEPNGQTTVIIVPDTLNQILDLLASEPAEPVDEINVVKNFATKKGISLSFETPNSSNVQRVTFNPITSEIGFVFNNDSVSLYPATFVDFIDAMTVPSVGKLQWQYRLRR